MNIQDGTGTSYQAKVDKRNQLHTFSVIESVVEDAVLKGQAYNINTGAIGLTSSTASAVLYFKNNEAPVNGESAFFVDAIAVGIDSAGTTASMSDITIVRNPTAGTIVSGATEVDIHANRNFGSSEVLVDSIIYKGAEGNTLTDGDDYAIFKQAAGTRGYYTLNTLLERGSSIGVKIDTQTTSGTTNVYVALIGHRVDGNQATA